jgi:hypothetical protein
MDFDIPTIATKIQEKIGQIEDTRKLLYQAGKEKAQATSDYDKALAIALIKLKEGQIQEFHGLKVGSVPASIAEKVAKGICSEERFKMELAETNYKSIVTKLDCIQSELNAYQSINRYLVHEA